MPCTSYPFSNNSSARKEPSCPVMPVINAVFIGDFVLGAKIALFCLELKVKSLKHKRSCAACDDARVVYQLGIRIHGDNIFRIIVLDES